VVPTPELAPYQDEPKQLASGTPGKCAYLRLDFQRRGSRTELAAMDRRAPLLVQRALYWDEEMPNLPCVTIISNAGGILQGDRYVIEIEVGEDAQAHVTTQAATKIHEMDANYASQTQDIVLHEVAYLEYMPDPIIPHKHSRFLTRTRLVIAPSSTLLYAEILTSGRKHYRDGERYAYDLFSSQLRAERPDGAELFAEKFVIEPSCGSVRQAGMMGQFDVFGNVVLLTPRANADRILEQVPAMLNREAHWAAGASRLPNNAGLIYKVLGRETRLVREKVREFWSVVRRIVVGCSLPGEFPWR
jgi:urease accessory protein